MSKKSRVTTLDIPEQVNYNGVIYTVTGIGDQCFKKCKSLTSVTIPNSIVSIGIGSFELCSSITSLTIPNSVTSIGSQAFFGCSSLASLILPEGLSTIEWLTFGYCNSLHSIVIPNSVYYIATNAFTWSGIKSIVIPNNVSFIGDQAFSRCSSLVSITIPNSVTKIGSMAFSHSPLLKKINYHGDEEQWRTIVKANDWDYETNFAISYQPIHRSQGQQIQLAQEKTQVPTVEKTPESAITPASTPSPQTIIQPEVSISAVDKNIPQTHIRNENTFVVIIANENYEQVASVPYAINDGQVFQQYCERTLGIPHQNIKTYIDATYNHIRAAQSWLQKICEVFEDEQIIFYYAGHGIPDESSRTAYLLPVDGIGTDILTGYKLDDLYSALGNIPAKNVIVFMDACFSGSKREEGMLASARGVAIKARSGMPKGNMVVFSAAQGDETAYPNNEERHGMFTYFLLKKLQDTKGDVTLHELGEYITKNVSQQSILLNGKSQTPCVTPSASLDASWREWKLK
ncbi:MAG: leucine-rich repeat protein [Paludibacteraceae bacterium]|nr:leucine-rich repeat protein [Paludibacteraceae bacterium]